ncbi:MAG TPA: hypothetical protein VIO81_00145 [Methyloversatilis sp.]
MTDAEGVLRFSERSSYQDAVGELLAHVSRTLDIFDTDLTGTGLAHSQRVAQLSDALAGDARASVRIALHDPSALQHHMPRLWDLCSAQSHRIQIRQTPRQLRHLSETFMLTTGGYALIRTHSEYWRGKLLRGDPVESAGYAGRFADLWEACSCCISTTKLGL